MQTSVKQADQTSVFCDSTENGQEGDGDDQQAEEQCGPTSLAASIRVSTRGFRGGAPDACGIFDHYDTRIDHGATQ